MSYTPNTWTNGDIITAEKMNALEQAVAGGGCVTYDATYDSSQYTLSIDGATYGDIRRAFASGKHIVLNYTTYYDDEGMTYYNIDAVTYVVSSFSSSSGDGRIRTEYGKEIYVALNQEPFTLEALDALPLYSPQK